MTDIDQLLRRLDEIPAPDLWPPDLRLRPTEGSSRRTSPRILAGCFLTLAVGTMGVVAVVSERSGDRRQVSAGPPQEVGTTRAPSTPTAGPDAPSPDRGVLPAPRVAWRTPLGRPLGPLAVGSGSVWVGTPSATDPAVMRIDATTGKPIASIPTGISPRSLAVGEGAVWVLGGGDGASPEAWLQRIDPRTNEPTGRLALDGAYDLAPGSGSVWVTNGRDRVWRLDARRLEVQAHIQLDRPAGVAFGFDAVWVTRPDAGVVERIDTSANVVTASIPMTASPAAIAVGERSVWVANFSEGSVSEIDPSTNTVVATLQVDGVPQGLAEHAGSLWVAVQLTPPTAGTSTARGAVFRIDLATWDRSTPVDTGQVRAAVGSHGGFWVGDQSQASVIRFE